MLKKEQKVIDSNERSFQPGEKVLCRDENKKQWKEGTVREPEGSIMYEVETKSGIERKHLDQLVPYHQQREQHTPGNHGENTIDNSVEIRPMEPNNHNMHNKPLNVIPESTRSDKIVPGPVIVNRDTSITLNSNHSPKLVEPVRRSTRETKPVERTTYTKLGG